MLTALFARWASCVEVGAHTRNVAVKHAQLARDPSRISPLSFPLGSDPFLQLLSVVTSKLIVYRGLAGVITLFRHCSRAWNEPEGVSTRHVSAEKSTRPPDVDADLAVREKLCLACFRNHFRVLILYVHA